MGNYYEESIVDSKLIKHINYKDLIIINYIILLKLVLQIMLLLIKQKNILYHINENGYFNRELKLDGYNYQNTNYLYEATFNHY